jgi:hypothetical protein
LAALSLLLGLAATELSAATFVKADVTAFLGPTFFVDGAAGGGTDAIVNQPAAAHYIRTFADLLSSNQGPTEIRLTGLGFVASANASRNDATGMTASFTYLGADGAVGGGDDVFLGSVAGPYASVSSGEYACQFDAPLVTNLNITGLRFLIAVAPTNAAGTGSVEFKVGAIPYDSITHAKFSVAGNVWQGLRGGGTG